MMSHKITGYDYLGLPLVDRRDLDVWLRHHGVIPSTVMRVEEEKDGRIHVRFHQRYSNGTLRLRYEGEEGPFGEIILPAGEVWPLVDS